MPPKTSPRPPGHASSQHHPRRAAGGDRLDVTDSSYGATHSPSTMKGGATAPKHQQHSTAKRPATNPFAHTARVHRLPMEGLLVDSSAILLPGLSPETYAQRIEEDYLINQLGTFHGPRAANTLLFSPRGVLPSRHGGMDEGHPHVAPGQDGGLLLLTMGGGTCDAPPALAAAVASRAGGSSSLPLHQAPLVSLASVSARRTAGPDTLDATRPTTTAKGTDPLTQPAEERSTQPGDGGGSRHVPGIPKTVSMVSMRSSSSDGSTASPGSAGGFGGPSTTTAPAAAAAGGGIGKSDPLMSFTFAGPMTTVTRTSGPTQKSDPAPNGARSSASNHNNPNLSMQIPQAGLSLTTTSSLPPPLVVSVLDPLGTAAAAAAAAEGTATNHNSSSSMRSNTAQSFRRAASMVRSSISTTKQLQQQQQQPPAQGGGGGGRRTTVTVWSDAVDASMSTSAASQQQATMEQLFRSAPPAVLSKLNSFVNNRTGDGGSWQKLGELIDVYRRGTLFATEIGAEGSSSPRRDSVFRPARPGVGGGGGAAGQAEDGRQVSNALSYLQRSAEIYPQLISKRSAKSAAYLDATAEAVSPGSGAGGELTPAAACHFFTGALMTMSAKPDEIEVEADAEAAAPAPAVGAAAIAAMDQRSRQMRVVSADGMLNFFARRIDKANNNNNNNQTTNAALQRTTSGLPMPTLESMMEDWEGSVAVATALLHKLLGFAAVTVPALREVCDATRRVILAALYVNGRNMSNAMDLPKTIDGCVTASTIDSLRNVVTTHSVEMYAATHVESMARRLQLKRAITTLDEVCAEEAFSVAAATHTAMIANGGNKPPLSSVTNQPLLAPMPPNLQMQSQHLLSPLLDLLLRCFVSLEKAIGRRYRVFLQATRQNCERWQQVTLRAVFQAWRGVRPHRLLLENAESNMKSSRAEIEYLSNTKRQQQNELSRVAVDRQHAIDTLRNEHSLASEKAKRHIASLEQQVENLKAFSQNLKSQNQDSFFRTQMEKVQTTNSQLEQHTIRLVEHLTERDGTIAELREQIEGQNVFVRNIGDAIANLTTNLTLGVARAKHLVSRLGGANGSSGALAPLALWVSDMAAKTTEYSAIQAAVMTKMGKPASQLAANMRIRDFGEGSSLMDAYAATVYQVFASMQPFQSPPPPQAEPDKGGGEGLLMVTVADVCEVWFESDTAAKAEKVLSMAEALIAFQRQTSTDATSVSLRNASDVLTAMDLATATSFRPHLIFVVSLLSCWLSGISRFSMEDTQRARAWLVADLNVEDVNDLPATVQPLSVIGATQPFTLIKARVQQAGELVSAWRAALISLNSMMYDYLTEASMPVLGGNGGGCGGVTDSTASLETPPPRMLSVTGGSTPGGGGAANLGRRRQSLFIRTQKPPEERMVSTHSWTKSLLYDMLRSLVPQQLKGKGSAANNTVNNTTATLLLTSNTGEVTTIEERLRDVLDSATRLAEGDAQSLARVFRYYAVVAMPKPSDFADGSSAAMSSGGGMAGTSSGGSSSVTGGGSSSSNSNAVFQPILVMGVSELQRFCVDIQIQKFLPQGFVSVAGTIGTLLKDDLKDLVSNVTKKRTSGGNPSSESLPTGANSDEPSGPPPTAIKGAIVLEEFVPFLARLAVKCFGPFSLNIVNPSSNPTTTINNNINATATTTPAAAAATTAGSGSPSSPLAAALLSTTTTGQSLIGSTFETSMMPPGPLATPPPTPSLTTTSSSPTTTTSTTNNTTTTTATFPPDLFLVSFRRLLQEVVLPSAMMVEPGWVRAVLTEAATSATLEEYRKLFQDLFTIAQSMKDTGKASSSSGNDATVSGKGGLPPSTTGRKGTTALISQGQFVNLLNDIHVALSLYDGVGAEDFGLTLAPGASTTAVTKNSAFLANDPNARMLHVALSQSVFMHAQQLDLNKPIQLCYSEFVTAMVSVALLKNPMPLVKPSCRFRRFVLSVLLPYHAKRMNGASPTYGSGNNNQGGGGGGASSSSGPPPLSGSSSAGGFGRGATNKPMNPSTTVNPFTSLHHQGSGGEGGGPLGSRSPQAASPTGHTASSSRGTGASSVTIESPRHSSSGAPSSSGGSMITGHGPLSANNNNNHQQPPLPLTVGDIPEESFRDGGVEGGGSSDDAMSRMTSYRAFDE